MSRPSPKPASVFLSCDWGTSVFRLRLVDVATLEVAAESKSDEGIGATCSAWKAAGADEARRWEWFRAVVSRHLVALERSRGLPLSGVPLLLSGMASATIGWCELPYRQVPFATDGSDLRVEQFAPADALPHPVVMISGVCSANDIMRGEETQLVGALVGQKGEKAPQTCIFPGTHSKHVTVEQGRACAFRTYMTGEFFALLSSQSVLAASVEANTDGGRAENRNAFETGVREGAKDNVLHACFKVRVRSVLRPVARTENYHYLSGLLIGAELKEIAATEDEIIIVGSEFLAARYCDALRVLGRVGRTRVVDATDALVRGQSEIGRRLGLLAGPGSRSEA